MPEAWVSKAGFPDCPLRAPEAPLSLLASHLHLDADTRLVMIGRETRSLLWFVFDDDRGTEAWIGMSPAGGEPWVFNGRTLKLSYRSPDKDLTPLHRRALSILGARLDGAPFERLLRIVKVPDAPPAGEKPPRPGLRSEDWAHPDHWREFIFFSVIDWCPSETFLGDSYLSGPACSLRYGDLECQSSHLYMDNVAQTPWEFTKDSSGEKQDHYLAMLDDTDVIQGTGVRKVESILDRLREAPSDGSLEFFNCCVPMMTGDAVRAPVASFQESTGRKVVFSDMSPLNCHAESLQRHIKRELSAAKKGPARPAAARFNLAGFRASRGRDELVALLARAGADLNLAILPAVELQSLSRYSEAGAQALLPSRYYTDIYAVLGEQGLPSLQDVAPYGPEGTRNWLASLAGLLGDDVKTRMEAVLADIGQGFRIKWDGLRERASRHRAAFIIGPGDAPRLADASLWGGAAVPALLDEIGFAVDLLAFAGEDGRAVAEAEALAKSLPGAARHMVLAFSERAGLHEHLRSGRISIAYSNLRRDRRLTCNGVMGFSLRDLEMGLDGSLRTAGRLLELCEVPFFREHAARLRKDP